MENKLNYILILFLVFYCLFLALSNHFLPLNSTSLLVAYFGVFFILTTFWGIFLLAINIVAVSRYNFYNPLFVPLVFYIIIGIITNLFREGMNISYHFLYYLITSSVIYFLFILLLERIFEKSISFSNRSNKSKEQPVMTNGARKKVMVLINPIEERIARRLAWPQLAFGIIAKLTPKDIFEIKIIDENDKPFEYIDADLVGITSFTPAITRAYQLASIYREKNIPVIMGGMHVSMLPDEALNFCDCVVIGEVENLWEKVLNDFLNNNLQSKYESEFIDIDGYVTPDRSVYENVEYPFASIETSRGCPMSCHFCSVSKFYRKSYRQRPIDEVLEELKTIKNRNVAFLDDNIVGFSKKSEQRALSLFKGIVENDLKLNWAGQTSLNVGVNEELLHWISKSGCVSLLIGLESLEIDELDNMNKSVNLKYNLAECVQNFKKYKIPVVYSIIMGMENETEEGLLKKIEKLRQSKMDCVQINNLTPYPGTKLFEDLEKRDRLLYKNFPEDWAKYIWLKPTIKFSQISQNDYVKTLQKGVKRLISFPFLLKTYFSAFIKTKSIKYAIINYAGIASSRESYLYILKQKVK